MCLHHFMLVQSRIRRWKFFLDALQDLSHGLSFGTSLQASISSIKTNAPLITTFGRADRLGEATTLDLPLAEALVPDEQERYCYPQVRVVQPGFYWKWPWQQVHRVSIATATMNMAYDPDEPQANKGGTILEAVTKDQLNIGLDGQIRYGVSEANLYAYLFGVKKPDSACDGLFCVGFTRKNRELRSPTDSPGDGRR